MSDTPPDTGQIMHDDGGVTGNAGRHAPVTKDH